MPDAKNAVGRKPDYKLKVLNKRTEQRGEVGAGWLNNDGSVSIVLNQCVVLKASQDMVITLFPKDELKP